MFYMVNKKQMPLAFLLQQFYAAWTQTVIDAKRDSLWDLKWSCAWSSHISWHKVEGKTFLFLLWKFGGGT
jgi:hypothetical protein